MAEDVTEITDTQRIEILKRTENIEFALSSLKTDTIHNPGVLKDRDVIVQTIRDNADEIHKILGFRK